MRKIVFHNRFHLGDHIFNFILFYHIKDYIEENDIYIDYHLHREYHKQVSEFNCSKNIRLFDFAENGLNMHIGNCNLKTWISNIFRDKCSSKFDIYYVYYYEEMLDIMNIPIKVNALEYTDADLLVRYNIINETHKNKYADLDFLILNSTAMSGQYTKNKDEWRELIIKLNSKFKIAITEKVDDVLCTINDNLTVKDIAAISTRAKKIIAVNSGPATGLFNTYTLNNVDIIYTFSFNETYAHHKFSSKLDIKELYFLADA